MAEQLTKWSVTDGTVIRHMHYGLRVQIPSGDIGVVDRVDIADNTSTRQTGRRSAW
ncbi:hypothetical protein [Streptomyces bobili]|uniref:Transposase n=1 Tax=Streptomyces bobili TaxID=67280 RepID=A0ABZ1RBF4_9ACTN|nr:hypothetical protein [Streptomyces bobili]